MARYPVWAQTTPLVTLIIKGRPGNSIWSWEGQTGCLSSYIHKQLPAGGVRGPSQRSRTIIDKDVTSGWRWTAVQLPIKSNESWCVTHLSWSSERMSKGWDIMVSSWLCKPFSWEINSKSSFVHRHNCIQLIQASLSYTTHHWSRTKTAQSSLILRFGSMWSQRYSSPLFFSALETWFRNQMKSFVITLQCSASVFPNIVDQ